MALPSSQRPIAAEEMLNEEMRVSLKIKVNKYDCFINMMDKWYKKLTKKNKRRLNKKRLKRHVLVVLKTLSMSYYALPLTWVETLTKDHGIKLVDTTAKKRTKKLKDSLSSELVNDEKTEVKIVNDDDSGHQLRRSPRTSSSGEKRKPLKIIDLTDDPPPPEWMLAYSRGVFLPRVQRMHTTESQIVIFYDYNPNLVHDDGTPYDMKGLKCHEGDGFHDFFKNRIEDCASDDGSDESEESDTSSN